MAKPKPSYTALKRQGEKALEQKDYAGALKLFEQALKLKPQSAEAYKNIGNVYNYMGKEQQAVCFFKKALKIDPQYWAAHNNLCIYYRKKRRPNLAIRHGNKALKYAPKKHLFLPHNSLGNLYGDLKKFRKAQYHFKKSIELNTQKLKLAEYNYGKLLFEHEHYKEALGLLEEAVKQLSSNENLSAFYYMLGTSYFKADTNIESYKKAEIYLQKALVLQKKNPSWVPTYLIHAILGEVYYFLKEYKLSNKHLQAAQKLSPEINSLWLGRNFYNLGKYAKAITIFENYLSTNTQKEDYLSDIYFYLAFSCYRLRKQKKAVNYARKYLERNHELNLHYCSGFINLMAGRYDKAAECFNKALKSNPEMSIIYWRLGFLYREQKDWDKALNIYSELLKKSPQQKTVYPHIAYVYYKKGNIELYEWYTRMAKT